MMWGSPHAICDGIGRDEAVLVVERNIGEVAAHAFWRLLRVFGAGCRLSKQGVHGSGPRTTRTTSVIAAKRMQDGRATSGIETREPQSDTPVLSKVLRKYRPSTASVGFGPTYLHI